MKRVLRLLLLVVATTFALTACGDTSRAGLGKSHASARILIKKDPQGVCKSKTIPQHHMLLKDEEDEIIWDVKVKDGCLSDSDIVLKWVVEGKNPTKCAEISSADAGQSKTKLHCDLGTYDLDFPYVYKVYLRKSGTDTVIEDPDVEIVMF